MLQSKNSLKITCIEKKNLHRFDKKTSGTKSSCGFALLFLVGLSLCSNIILTSSSRIALVSGYPSSSSTFQQRFLTPLSTRSSMQLGKTSISIPSSLYSRLRFEHISTIGISNHNSLTKRLQLSSSYSTLSSASNTYQSSFTTTGTTRYHFRSLIKLHRYRGGGVSSSSLYSSSSSNMNSKLNETVMKAEEKKSSVKAITALDDISKTGEFKRKQSSWRKWISSENGAEFPPEAGRYHVYAAHACPWAHRAVMTIKLKGLDHIIGVTYVHPTWQFTKPGVDDHRGWVFGSKDKEPMKSTSGIGSFPSSWGDSDPHYQSFSVRDLYERADDGNGKYTVPILWDTKTNTIVNNESSEVIRMLNSEFNEFAKHPELDLFPQNCRKEIEAVNDWVYPTINNGVYRCGFASTQEAYNIAIDQLTESFDRIDSILQKQRFIAGNEFTEADVRLFVTLLRFDEVYIVYFKVNTRSVSWTPTILNYMREIYQMDGVAETCHMDMIKAHYYTSHVELNKYSIIPKGSNFMELLKEPHNREETSYLSK